MEVVPLTALGFALIVLLVRLGWVMLKEERFKGSSWALIWMAIALGVCAGPPAVVDWTMLDGWVGGVVLGVSLVIAIWAPVHVRRKGGSGIVTFVLIGVAYVIGFYGWFDAVCAGC